MEFNLRTRRRGLSSVVGTLFFIALMVGAFSALLAAFSYQNSLIDTQKTIADLEIAKSRENFIVHGETKPPITCTPTIPNDNCLELTVNNRGTNTVEVDKIWVIEKADGDGDGSLYEADVYDSSTTSSPQLDFNDLIVPLATLKVITTDQIEINSSEEYTVKVVSKLGTIVSIDIPDIGDGPPGEQGVACWDLNEDGFKNLTFPDPPYPGGIFTLDGIDYTTEDRDGSTAVNPADCIGESGSPGPTPPIDDDLLNKPGIFLLFPSPFGINPGTSTNKGYWGAIIANPTQYDMTVNKIVITTVLTGAAPGETTFPLGCSIGVGWSCGNNQLIWEGSPVIIPKRSSTPFVVNVKPDNTIGKNQNGMPVFASVLTDFGQFGKTNYLSSMIKPGNSNWEAPIVNIYRSDSVDSTTDIKGNLDLLPETNPPSSFTTHFTIAEFGDDDAFLNSGAEIIVNIPKGYTSVSGSSDTAGVFTVTTDGDSQDGWQVRGVLNENIGDGVAGHMNARSISVTATPPALNPPEDSALSIFYVVATGSASYRTSTGNPLCPGNCAQWEVGPLAEVIIKITENVP